MAFDHSLVQWKHRRLASVCECGFADGTPGGEGDSIVVRSVTMQLSKQRAHAAPLRAPRSLRDGFLRMYDIWIDIYGLCYIIYDRWYMIYDT